MSQDQSNELEQLKSLADDLGVKYHPSISAEKLKEKLDAVMGDAPGKDSDEDVSTKPLSRKEIEDASRREAGELIRVRVTNMDPNNRDWEGEIFTAGNSVVGTYKKYVPFDTEFHVPRIILNMMKERMCQVFESVRDSRGNSVRKGKLIKAFAIQELDPLTPAELKNLAQRQAMANGTAEG